MKRGVAKPAFNCEIGGKLQQRLGNPIARHETCVALILPKHIVAVETGKTDNERSKCSHDGKQCGAKAGHLLLASRLRRSAGSSNSCMKVDLTLKLCTFKTEKFRAQIGRKSRFPARVSLERDDAAAHSR